MKRKIPAPEAGGFSKPVTSPSVLRVMCVVAAIQLGWTVMVLAQAPVDGQKAVTVASELRNFISGLILLAEQPIRVGDLIEMESEYGIVARIGPAARLCVPVPASKWSSPTANCWNAT